jgi:hypothetical protein
MHDEGYEGEGQEGQGRDERRPDAYGLSFSDHEGSFELMPYDRYGRPIHHHPLTDRRFATPGEAYAAIREFEDAQRAA